MLSASCKHKLRLLCCPHCKLNVCTKCIQLEVHGCAGLAAAKSAELALLEKKMERVVAPKVGAI